MQVLGAAPGEAEGWEAGCELSGAGSALLGIGGYAEPSRLLSRYWLVFLQVWECLQQFKVTKTQLQQIQASLLGSMEQALTGGASPASGVRMLPTYVGSTPHGNGGWHRIRWVRLVPISKAL